MKSFSHKCYIIINSSIQSASIWLVWGSKFWAPYRLWIVCASCALRLASIGNICGVSKKHSEKYYNISLVRYITITQVSMIKILLLAEHTYDSHSRLHEAYNPFSCAALCHLFASRFYIIIRIRSVYNIQIHAVCVLCVDGLRAHLNAFQPSETITTKKSVNAQNFCTQLKSRSRKKRKN